MKEKGMLPSTSSWGNAISRQTLRELGNHSLESGKCRNRYLTQARKVKDERLPLPGGIWKSHSYIRDSLHFQSLMEQRKTPWISQGPWVDLQENTSLGSFWKGLCPRAPFKRDEMAQQSKQVTEGERHQQPARGRDYKREDTGHGGEGVQRTQQAAHKERIRIWNLPYSESTKTRPQPHQPSLTILCLIYPSLYLCWLWRGEEGREEVA